MILKYTDRFLFITFALPRQRKKNTQITSLTSGIRLCTPEWEQRGSKDNARNLGKDSQTAHYHPSYISQHVHNYFLQMPKFS